MTPTPQREPNRTAAPTPEQARALGALLDGLRGENEQLLGILRAHRDAIRRADGRAVEACTRAQGSILGRLADLEDRRRVLVAELCADPMGARGGPPTLSCLAGRFPEPERGTLAEGAARLASLLAEVQRETATVRFATQSLVAHMSGLMRQVARSLSHAGTYSARGSVDAGAAVVSALDLVT